MSDRYFVRPLFRVRDVAASVAYYRDKLGCTMRWSHGDDAPIIAEVERGELAIILDSDSALTRPAGSSVVTLSVNDLGALHRELADRGALVVAPPFPVVWGDNYQFDVQDPDGNLLLFWGPKPE